MAFYNSKNPGFIGPPQTGLPRPGDQTGYGLGGYMTPGDQGVVSPAPMRTAPGLSPARRHPGYMGPPEYAGHPGYMGPPEYAGPPAQSQVQTEPDFGNWLQRIASMGGLGGRQWNPYGGGKEDDMPPLFAALLGGGRLGRF